MDKLTQHRLLFEVPVSGTHRFAFDITAEEHAEFEAMPAKLLAKWGTKFALNEISCAQWNFYERMLDKYEPTLLRDITESDSCAEEFSVDTVEMSDDDLLDALGIEPREYMPLPVAVVATEITIANLRAGMAADIWYDSEVFEHDDDDIGSYAPVIERTKLAMRFAADALEELLKQTGS